MAEPTAVGAVDPRRGAATGTARANESVGSGGFLKSSPQGPCPIRRAGGKDLGAVRIYKTYGPDAIQVMTEKQSWSRPAQSLAFSSGTTSAHGSPCQTSAISHTCQHSQPIETA